MAIINGTPGDDELLNTVGESDTIDGGLGTDTMSYAGAGGGAGVIIDLSLGGAFDLGNFDSDTLISIENVIGSAFDDVITGNEQANVLDGAAGNDLLSGGGGIDSASYASASLHGATVDLSTGTASDDGNGGIDFLTEIENLTGSSFDDRLTGDGEANVLDGAGGQDTLQGGAGNDVLIGGTGADVFKYSFEVEPGSGGGDIPASFGEWLSEVHELNIGTLKQNEFVQNYKGWLDYLAGELRDNHGFDTIPQNAKVSFKQNDAGGTPQIEGLTSAQLDQIFGDATAITIKTGKTSQERFYSDIDANSDVWGGDSEDTVASTDGFDTIVDFNFAEDKLEFNGLGADFTEAQFMSLFQVSNVDTDNDTVADSTTLALDDSTPADNNWSVTVQGLGHTEAEFYGSSIFS